MIKNYCRILLIVAAVGLSCWQLKAADITWDNGGNDAKWSTATNWSDNLAPSVGNDYSVNSSTIESLGRGDSAANVTYTFAGDSLTITNGSTFLLYKENGGGADYMHLNIPNLTVENSRIQHQCNRNLYVYLNDNLRSLGDNDLYITTGPYQRYMILRGGMTGSGTFLVHRDNSGASREMELESGDYSGYSGDWTVENGTAGSTLFVDLRISTATGWGSGNMKLGDYGRLYLDVPVDAPGSNLSVSEHAAMVLSSVNTTSTVHQLWIENAQVDPGVYNAAKLSSLASGASFTGNGMVEVLQGPVIVNWDAGGSDDYWYNTNNWDNNLPPGNWTNYVVNGAVIQDPGGNDGTITVTYTFQGSSLTITNGGTLYLRKQNAGGHDFVTEVIPGLTVQDSTIQQKCASKITHHYMAEPVHILGNSTIYFEGGTYGSHLYLNDGMTGSGTLRVYRTNVGSTGPDIDNGTHLFMNQGDFSGYSGDWTIENSVNSEWMEFVINTTTGWGTGNVTLNRGGLLQFNASVNADTSAIVMSTTETQMIISSDVTATVKSLKVDGKTIYAGTYTADELNTESGSTIFSGAGILELLEPYFAGTVIMVN